MSLSGGSFDVAQDDRQTGFHWFVFYACYFLRVIGIAMPFKVQLFISHCEIKSGIHEPRIGNAVPAGDAGECDTPAKV